MTIQQHASFDSSAAELNATSKLVKAWESKNAKNAGKAGGISMMALSLAACGGSSSTVTTPVVDTPVVDTPVVDTPVVVAPSAIALAASNTTETVVGTLGNDSITATAANYEDTDRIIDASGTDADTLVITEAAAINPDVTNVEGITLNLNALGAANVDASKITGADTLTINRGDVEVGGSTLTGDKTVVVSDADASGVAKIIVGAGTTTVDIDSAAADKAGLVVDADAATTSVSVEGASTVNAAIATTLVEVVASLNTDAAEVAKATVVNAAAAATVTTHAGLTGAVTINAAKASTITVNDAQGGAVVNGATTSTADSTITIVDVDASGATVTTGTGSATASAKQINVTLDGTALTTDTATVSGSGVIALDLDATSANTVDIVTLIAAEANATYNVAANAETITSITKGESGSFTVTVAGNEAQFSAVTIAGVDTLDLNAGTAGTIDGSKWTSVGKVDLGFDNAGNAITVSEAAVYSVTANQTGLDFDMGTGASSMSIVSGDVNGATDTTVGTLTVGALDAAASATSATTVVLTAEESNFTATSVVVGAKQVLEVKGDENVSLGNVTAKDVNAGSSTGNITLTAQTALSGTVTTGTGADDLTASGGDVHTFAAGAGNDTITVTTTSATSSFDGGAGDDAFTLTSTSAYAAVGGAGDDTFTTGADLEASVVGGDGSDTLTLSAAINFSDNNTFAMGSIEKLNLTDVDGNTTFSAAQLANNATMVITATGGNDALIISNPATGGVLDGSGLTTATGSALSALTYVGSVKADTITGGVLNETFVQTKEDDTITGGEKSGDSDKLTAITTADSGTGVASVINMSTGAITATEILDKTGYRTALDVSAAAGTMQTLFNDSVATNDAAVTTFSEIEVVVGTSGKDYIKGSSGADTITGAAGNDYIHAGDGDDTVNAEDTDTNLNGGGGVDTISIAADADFSGDTFAGFEKAVMAEDKDLTIDGADVASFTDVTGVAGGAVELFTVVGTTGADTIDLSGITYTNAGVSIDMAAGADTVTIGTAATAVQLGGTDGAADTVILKSTSGVTTITEFEAGAGTDVINIDDLTAETAATTLTGNITLAAGKVYYAAGAFNDDMSDVDADVLTDINGAATITEADVVAYIVAVDTTTDNMALFKYDYAAAGGIVAGELTLVAESNGEILAADFAFA
ncbi:hypothetical protein N9Y66_02590 [Planktomarina temperata]|nr:hypothetical protein [Planktomarina temperata]